MLPLVQSKTKNTLIAGLTALALTASAAAPAHAWGEREQQFLAGVVTTVVIGAIIKNARRPDVVVVQPKPVPTNYVPVPSVNIYATPCAYGFNSYTSTQRRAIQTQLRAAGYYNGSIDGVFGPATYNAVVAYARATGQSDRLNSNAGVYGIFDNLVY